MVTRWFVFASSTTTALSRGAPCHLVTLSLLRFSIGRPDRHALGRLGEANFHEMGGSGELCNGRLKSLADMLCDAFRGGIELAVEGFQAVEVLIAQRRKNLAKEPLGNVKVDDGFDGIKPLGRQFDRHLKQM